MVEGWYKAVKSLREDTADPDHWKNSRVLPTCKGQELRKSWSQEHTRAVKG